MNVCDIPLDKLCREDFEPLVNRYFKVSSSPDEEPLAELTLEEACIGGPEQPGIRQAFLLIFSGPKEIILPQHIYTLSAPDFGSLSIFLVPIQPDSKGSRYQAVFN